MNKKILISLSVIAAVAALAIGGTVAYFSDTETSAGNTFTAGTLDLSIDLDGTWRNPWTGSFFNEIDMKPGDQVEKTISLHVDNDAWLCYKITPTAEDDNYCNEPEIAAGDTTCDLLGGGELQANSQILIWSDQGLVDGWQCSKEEGPACNDDPQEGDNKYQHSTECGGECEPIIYKGLVSNLPTGWVQGDLTKSQTEYIGIKFCVGAVGITGSETGTVVTCDGSEVDNIIQSDSWIADVTFLAEQKKNNPVFTCPPQ